MCTCTVDEAPLDPWLLDDPVGDCANSALLNIPQTEFTLAVSKQREPHSFQIAFANAGDKPLKWNITTIRASGTAAPWLVTPRAGALIGCDLGSITLALSTRNLTARSDPYTLQLELTSNSYRDAARNLTVVAFVSAKPVPSLSFVTITTLVTQLSAGGMVNFVVTSIDAAGVAILDTSNQAYFAVLSHPESNTSVSCRVGFDTSSKKQKGACEIPALLCNTDTQCSPPVGSFVLGVTDSDGMVVGLMQSFNVESCPPSFYGSDGTCLPCSDHVNCVTGSKISDWQLHEGYWRVDDKSDTVFECHFGSTSCPGTSVLDDNSAANCSNAKWPYCKCGFAGALCAVCAPYYYESWGDTPCVDCGNEKGRAQAIAIGTCLFVLTIAGIGIAITQRKRIVDTTRYRKVRYFCRLGKVKMHVVFFALQV